MLAHFVSVLKERYTKWHKRVRTSSLQSILCMSLLNRREFTLTGISLRRDTTSSFSPSAVPAAFCMSLKNKLFVIVQYELFEVFKHNPNACINFPFMSNYSCLLQYGEVSFDSALGYRQSFRHLHWKSLRQVSR